VETEGERSRDRTERGWFAPGNKAAVGRSARSALRAPYRAAEKRISEALAAGDEPTDSDRLLADALAVYHAARRELGSSSAFVQGPCLAYAVETVLAGYFVREAAREGFLSTPGLRFHDRALACEQAAARALTAALAAAKALGARRRQTVSTVLAAIEAAGNEADDEDEVTP
jgi:hypothetical protein